MRDRLIFIIGILVFVALVPLAYWLLFERGMSVSPEEQSLPRAPGGLDVRVVEEEGPRIPVALSVTRVDGKVEVRRAQGAWRPAEEGTVLGARDGIRTDPASTAELSMPGVFSVQLDSGSEFTVRSLAQNVARFMLEEGMISADVVDSPERLFEVAASSSVARTHGGSFRMNVDREGRVDLGTSRGSVEVEAAGKVIQVREGYQTRVAKGKKPLDPIKIPSKLFLKVRWPKKKALSKRTLVVAGRTRPGARVRIDGRTVPVDKRGRFRKKVALKEGANRVKVESYDVGGNRSKLDSPKLTVDTRPDGFQIRTSPEMWEKKKSE